MPTIAIFYGIVIRMNYKPKEHEPSHIHASYQDYSVVINIETLRVIEGTLPTRALKMVLEWMEYNQRELVEMWDTQNVYKLRPLL